MDAITLLFVLEKETKGAVRYMEVDSAGPVAPEAAHVGTIYFRKAHLPSPPPSRLRVTVQGV